MKKVHSLRVWGSCLTDNESNFLPVCKDMTILKYDPLLSYYSISILFTYMTVGAEYTAAALISISHNMDDELINPFRNPLVYLNLGDMFDYNCRSYWFSKQMFDVVIVHDSLENNSEHVGTPWWGGGGCFWIVLCQGGSDRMVGG